MVKYVVQLVRIPLVRRGRIGDRLDRLMSVRSGGAVQSGEAIRSGKAISLNRGFRDPQGDLGKIVASGVRTLIRRRKVVGILMHGIIRHVAVDHNSIQSCYDGCVTRGEKV
ncbi:hypothetical protein NHQ30_010866 [Ciborinia camelliae]|nr:hypothetical protein NHQ30_010866 [Ciborinia camelliae]